MCEVNKKDLIDLYSAKSKHSNYQALPGCLLGFITDNELEVKSRAEWQRLEYMLANVDVEGKSVLDIGGNSGFFAFELVEHGAGLVCLFEGNREHADFARLAAQYLKIDSIKVTNEYYNFDNPYPDKFDICLLLNVLHHVGDDYGEKNLCVGQAKEIITKHLRRMSSVSKVMIFQIGFNWKGDPTLPLFDRGTKRELIDFVLSAIQNSGWVLEKIGIYDEDSDSYQSPNTKNLARFDALGEFLNRPIFILRTADDVL